MFRWLVVLCAVGGVGLACGGASAQCLDGTSSAELQTSGPFAGLWKYTLLLNWDTPQGLSNVTLDFGLDACPAAACNTNWIFDDPAGTGTGGEPNDCDYELSGEFNCNGNPSIGVDYPILKWDAVSGDCEPAATGSAMLCFYVSAGPQAPSASVALIKNGQMVCEGTVFGEWPLICPTPIQDSSWSKVKSEY